MVALTSYAVVTRRALDIKQVARTAIQYLLARYTLTALGLAPFVYLLARLWRHRGLPMEEVMTGKEGPALVTATVVGVVFLRFRRPILDAIDRRFFRERYEARRVLTELSDRVRGSRSLEELARLVRHGVDVALHVEGVSLLVRDPTIGRFVDPLGELRPLDAGARLATLVQSHHQPMAVDLEAPGSPFQTLGESDQYWLIGGQVAMLAPVFALEGSMIGLLALGRKRSELPFLKEDRDLLRGVCSNISLVIELLFLKERTPTPRGASPESAESPLFPPSVVEDGTASECLVCSRIYPPGEAACPRCELELEPTLVPYVLRSQFRFEKRIGTGGMAVVFSATDLRLGRTVAIKTLPRVSPDAAMRLHREARAAASVAHPGLAAIYGIETWDGVPMLILEMLDNGTLADRLMRTPLDVGEMIETGQSVALALDKIHSVGILHRDVKPSNIGYTSSGEAKLLDFGIARIQYDLTHDGETHPPPEDNRSVPQTATRWILDRTATGQILGTASYLSPEAVRGVRPVPSFDLWALSVVLYESLVAENLFLARGIPEMLAKIRSATVPDLREKLAGCSEPLAEFFARELHPDLDRRAASGRELRDRLETLRLDLGIELGAGRELPSGAQRQLRG